jgi:hypothetical protein
MACLAAGESQGRTAGVGPVPSLRSHVEVDVSELTDEQRALIDDLAKSMSKLCHAVIRKRLEQFFEVIGEELGKHPPV